MRAEIIETKVLYENEHSAHNYIGWPTVARLRDGKLMMVASGFGIWFGVRDGKVLYLVVSLIGTVISLASMGVSFI